MFWNADYAFLKSVVENKLAYDGFINYSIEVYRQKLIEKRK